MRLLNVLPMTPVMLAEYVPADFDEQQRRTAEEALDIVAKESGLDARHVSVAVRQGGVHHEIMEEATEIAADLTLSIATVKTYVTRLLTKLDARDRVQLVIIAYDAGLVAPAR